MSIHIVKTVKIMPSHPSQGAFVEINESDFDAQKHKLYTAGEPAKEPAKSAKIAPPPPAAVPAPAPVSADVKITSDAQKLADEAGLDLANVVGTGHNGKITVKDVENAIDALTAPAVPGVVEGG